MVSANRPNVVYDLMVAMAGWFAPRGRARQRLARRFKSDASTVPDLILGYAAIYALTVVIILLSLRALFIICTE